jgi:hypothetical protein
MITSCFDLHADSEESNLLISNDQGEVLLLDFDVRNSQNDEMSKKELVKNTWKVESDQNILQIQISPFFPNIFLVLTQLVFYIFDKDFEKPLFVSPFSKKPNSCCKWSISRYVQHHLQNIPYYL